MMMMMMMMKLSSVAVQPGLCRVGNPEDRFSHHVAQILFFSSREGYWKMHLLRTLIYLIHLLKVVAEFSPS